MTISRKSVADTLDEYDDQIADLQDGKRETLQEYRAQLAEQGMGKDEIKVEIEATKAAIKRRRAMREKGVEAVEHKDALVDEIFAEITGTVVATHVARGARDDEHDADGVIIENTEPAHSDPQGAAAAPAEGSDEPSLPSAIQSTAAGKDRQDSTEGDPAPVALDREAATTPPASESPPVDTPSTPDKSGEGGLSPAPVVTFKRNDKPLRPYCVPDASGVCASPGGKKHCFRCEQLHQAGGEFPTVELQGHVN